MPTVNVRKDAILRMIELPDYTDHDFHNLCFEFGIELDEVTSDRKMFIDAHSKQEFTEAELSQYSDDVVYKIDIPANRYDLLCIEGIALALRIFLEKQTPIEYNISTPPDDDIFTMTVSKETDPVRPYAVCAVLRNIKFDQARYESFIDLQDKLHFNIGRRRTLIAIGTHDLDTIQAPFRYQAKPQKDIHFVALNETQDRNVEELFAWYKDQKQNHLKQYLPITEDSPVHPVIYDKNDTVLSLPPIINGDHSKIHLKTQNVFIECTGTDRTKLNTVLNTVIAMFSGYCTIPYSVERCKVVYEATGETVITPDLSNKEFLVDIDYVVKGIGNVEIDAKSMVKMLNRMSLPAEPHGADQLKVLAPPTRTDILHMCDIKEDVAIAFGYDNIPKTMPACNTVGLQEPINKFSDLNRQAMAGTGYSEVLTFVLTCKRDNFQNMLLPLDTDAVAISNVSHPDFDIVRTMLIPGLLQVVKNNNGISLPLKIFELSDVGLLDPESDVGATNNRRLAAMYGGIKSGLEDIHGLLHRIMQFNGVALVAPDDGKRQYDQAKVYWVTEDGCDKPFLFPGRRVDVYISGTAYDNQPQKLGHFGIIHPTVLANFDIKIVCSALELDMEILQVLPE